MRVWLDVEFTCLESPELLSAGFVSEDGRELYVELLNEELHSRTNAFVREHVLPFFGRVPGARADDYQELTRRLEAFLLGFVAVELLYDFKTDRELVQHALEHGPSWEDLKSRVSWRNASIETCSDIAQNAMDATFDAAGLVGLARHHALVDARALRSAHLASGNE